MSHARHLRRRAAREVRRYWSPVTGREYVATRVATHGRRARAEAHAAIVVGSLTGCEHCGAPVQRDMIIRGQVGCVRTTYQLCPVQAEREERDDWIEIVEVWLAAPIRSSKLEDGITTADVLIGALGLLPAHIEQRHTQRAGRALKSLKFERRQVRQGAARPWRYFPTIAQPDEDDLDPER